MDYYAKSYTDTHDQTNIQANNYTYYLSHADGLAAFIGARVANLSIADIGCSIPHFLRAAQEKGYARVIGVDFATEAHAYGKTHGIEMYTPDDFLRAVPDDSLDILRYSHTLEHLIEPAKCLHAQARKLKAGGLLYITQPNFPVFFAQHPKISNLKDAVWPEHLHFFSPISLARMAEDAGFSISKIFSCGDEVSAWALYETSADLEYAKTMLAPFAEKGESNWEVLNSYPFYAGENSAFYARKGRPSWRTACFSALRRIRNILK
jgi:SAM-dependent methyltransferase